MLRWSEECLAIATQRGYAHWRFTALGYQGWALALGGVVEKSLSQICETAAYLRKAGARLSLAMECVLLVEAYAHAGRGREALAAAEEGLALLDEHSRDHVGFLQVLLHCARSDALLALRRPDSAGAEVECGRALMLARQQGALGLELYAAVRLGRLWRRQGRDRDARVLLEPLYGQFSEGHNTALVRKAKELLDSLPFAPAERPGS